MSVLSEIFNALTGNEGTAADTVTDRPCANCPSDCAIAGDACSVCEPYKKSLIDVIYYVNNLEEYYAKYEIVGEAVSPEAKITCPYCGGQSADLQICEFCGSKLSDSEVSGKIRIAKASDIPNPIMQAQDIIYERSETVIKKYSAQDSSDGLLNSRSTS